MDDNTISEQDTMTILNEHIEIETIIKHLNNKYIDKFRIRFQEYISKKIIAINNEKGLEEKQYEFIISKISIYYLLLLLKIRTSKMIQGFNITGVEMNDYINYDDIYRESASSVSTRRIFKILDIKYVEIYIRWLIKKAFQSDIYEMTYFMILLKRLCLLKNDDFFWWLFDKYDTLPLAVMIINRKMYEDDDYYDNKYYAKMFKMNLREINNLEMSILMLVDLYITDDEYQEIIGEKFN